MWKEKQFCAVVVLIHGVGRNDLVYFDIAWPVLSKGWARSMNTQSLCLGFRRRPQHPSTSFNFNQSRTHSEDQGLGLGLLLGCDDDESA